MMRIPRALGGLVTLGLLLVAQSASAATIDFTSLARPGTGITFFGQSVLVDGFLFSSDRTDSLGTWQLDSGSHANDATAASTTLVEYFAFATTTITRQGGGTFDLNQIDLAPWGAGQGGPNFSVLFTGVQLGGAIVTQSITVQNLFTGAGRPQLQTGYFTGFTNLTSVYMTQGVYSPGAGTSFQFNNIVVDAQSVPDPASTAGLLGLGLAALAGTARRLRRRG